MRQVDDHGQGRDQQEGDRRDDRDPESRRDAVHGERGDEEDRGAADQDQKHVQVRRRLARRGDQAHVVGLAALCVQDRHRRDERDDVGLRPPDVLLDLDPPVVDLRGRRLLAGAEQRPLVRGDGVGVADRVRTDPLRVRLVRQVAAGLEQPRHGARLAARVPGRGVPRAPARGQHERAHDHGQREGGAGQQVQPEAAVVRVGAWSAVPVDDLADAESDRQGHDQRDHEREDHGCTLGGGRRHGQPRAPNFRTTPPNRLFPRCIGRG